MCGIAGYLSVSDDADAAIVQAMCDEIRHRGPDDFGLYTDGGCGIGMRRLSIIDLSTGHQPIANEDESVWIVFNGEIYNFLELRPWLESRGHRFRTHTDTEAIVHLYEEEGVNGIARLRGMFAFAIWDRRRRRLLLARDRFGKKPLYYAVLPNGLWFGSELKCLEVAGVPLRPDHDALQLYFQFSYIPDPYSVYRDVRKLPAGCWMTFDAAGHLEQGRYWSWPRHAVTEPEGVTEQAAADRIREVFDESVRIRMIADVPLGAFLSGGIDSGSVVASMALQSREPVKTFSIGFEEAGFNELEAAALVARRFNTEHHAILVRPDSVALVQRIVRHFDEPFGDASALPTFVVSEFAVQHVKVALSGDGGDEIFAGYWSVFQIDRLKAMGVIPSAAQRCAGLVADLLPYSTYGKNYLRLLSRPSALDRYFEGIYAPQYLLERLLQPAWLPPADAAYVRRMLPACLLEDEADLLSQALYFEMAANLTGDMLVKVDRMSMANSLEVRCPLLDHRLAELAATIPPAWNMRNGRGKQIFIKAVGDRLPPELLRLPKKGFGVPLASWFRNSVRELLTDSLTSQRALNRGIVSPDFVRYLIDEHQRERRDNSVWLWRLLMLELWFQNYEQRTAPTRECGATVHA